MARYKSYMMMMMMNIELAGIVVVTLHGLPPPPAVQPVLCWRIYSSGILHSTHTLGRHCHVSCWRMHQSTTWRHSLPTNRHQRSTKRCTMKLHL